MKRLIVSDFSGEDKQGCEDCPCVPEGGNRVDKSPCKLWGEPLNWEFGFGYNSEDTPYRCDTCMKETGGEEIFIVTKRELGK